MSYDENVDAFFYVRKRFPTRGTSLNFVKQELALYSNPHTGCFDLGIARLEKICGIKRCMLRNHIRTLVEEGVVEIIPLRNAKGEVEFNHYRIIGLREYLNGFF